MEEWGKIMAASAVTGPATWPIAARLISEQLAPTMRYRFTEQVKKHGWSAMMRGVAPYAAYKVFGIGVQRGVQAPVISSLQAFRSRLIEDAEKEDDKVVASKLRLLGDVPIFVLSGIASGVVGGVLVTPIEQLKISSANRDFPSASATRAFFLGRGVEGYRALFAGTRITVLRSVIFDSVNAVLYNVSLATFSIERTDVIGMTVINAFAGVTTAIVDYPLDVLKTRIQSRTVSNFSTSSLSTGAKSGIKGGSPSPPPISIAGIALTMIKEEGVSSLYGGLRQKLVLYFAVWAVYGASYAVIGKLLQSK